MNIDIQPYSKESLEGFVYNGTEREISGQQINEIVEFYAGFGDVFVGKINDKIIGVGGIYPLWRSAGSCFLFLNKEAEIHKVSVFKVLLKYVNVLIKKHDIKTLIVECLDGSLKANNLINHLGFTKNREFKMAMYVRSQL